ncbi:hypothetical protein [Sphaerisporangium rhizosphaerae]|uniref:Uncharacterized protein n=1 Tax=Sphaerisporangium rhizosphaerae TaxID=2269375 RepID=A0ABW2PB70_9ACTN
MCPPRPGGAAFRRVPRSAASRVPPRPGRTAGTGDPPGRAIARVTGVVDVVGGLAWDEDDSATRMSRRAGSR